MPADQGFVDVAPSAPRTDATRVSVATRLVFAVPRDEAWNTLAFYEQIEERPPLSLRLLLPVPIRTEGKKSVIGDEAMCLYEGGHLVKRVTRVEHGHRYEFSVVAQELAIRGGLQLGGGRYALRELGPDSTEVELSTTYVSELRPRWFWRIIEAAVCHAFHRHILRAMRRQAEARRLHEAAR
jgi:hypothetical protein